MFKNDGLNTPMTQLEYIEHLEAELVKYKQLLQECASDADGYMAERDRLEERLEQAEADAEQAGAELAEAHQERMSLTEKIADRDEELAALRGKHWNQSADIVSVRAELAEWKEKARTENRDREYAEHDAQRLEAELAEEKEKLKQKTLAHKAICKDFDDLEDTTNKVEAERDRLQETNEGLRESIVDIEAANLRLNVANRELRGESDRLREVAKELKQDVEAGLRRNRKLREALERILDVYDRPCVGEIAREALAGGQREQEACVPELPTDIEKFIQTVESRGCDVSHHLFMAVAKAYREGRRVSDRESCSPARLRRMVDQFWALINNSHGVDGLHLNGDVAPWDSLLPGGEFEAWLSEMETEEEQSEQESDCDKDGTE